MLVTVYKYMIRVFKTYFLLCLFSFGNSVEHVLKCYSSLDFSKYDNQVPSVLLVLSFAELSGHFQSISRARQTVCLGLWTFPNRNSCLVNNQVTHQVALHWTAMDDRIPHGHLVASHRNHDRSRQSRAPRMEQRNCLCLLEFVNILKLHIIPIWLYHLDF